MQLTQFFLPNAPYLILGLDPAIKEKYLPYKSKKQGWQHKRVAKHKQTYIENGQC